MKKLIPIGLLALTCAFTLHTKVDWTWHGKPILVVRDGGATLELGLATDGTVLWREVTSTTNSPAEVILGEPWYKVMPVPQVTPPTWWTLTNIVMTNELRLQFN